MDTLREVILSCASLSLMHSLICLVFSEVFNVGVWSDSSLLRDVHLRRLTSDLMELQLCSNSTSTVSKYVSGWNKWRSWAMYKAGVPVVPEHPLHVGLFLTELCISAMENGTGISVLEAAVYSIRWAH